MVLFETEFHIINMHYYISVTFVYARLRKKYKCYVTYRITHFNNSLVNSLFLRHECAQVAFKKSCLLPLTRLTFFVTTLNFFGVRRRYQSKNMILGILVYVSRPKLLFLNLHLYVVILYMNMRCQYLPLMQCSHIYNWLIG